MPSPVPGRPRLCAAKTVFRRDLGLLDIHARVPTPALLCPAIPVLCDALSSHDHTLSYACVQPCLGSPMSRFIHARAHSYLHSGMLVLTVSMLSNATMCSAMSCAQYSSHTHVQPYPCSAIPMLSHTHAHTHAQPYPCSAIPMLIPMLSHTHVQPYPCSAIPMLIPMFSHTHAQPYPCSYPCSAIPMLSHTHAQPYPCSAIPMFSHTMFIPIISYSMFIYSHVQPYPHSAILMFSYTCAQLHLNLAMPVFFATRLGYTPCASSQGTGSGLGVCGSDRSLTCMEIGEVPWGPVEVRGCGGQALGYLQ